MVWFATVASPVTRKIVDGHLLSVLRGDLSRKLVDQQRIELRDLAFLVDHLEQIRPNLRENRFEIV